MKLFTSAQRKMRRGFTLIELLLVIGIIAILASIVIVAINPTKQLGDARNAQRRSDVNTVLNAVYQYAIDNNGNLPSGIPTLPSDASTGYLICNANAAIGVCNSTGTNAVRLQGLTGSYLVNMPVDPSNPSTATGTAYYIFQDSGGRVTVRSAKAEQSATISVTR